MNVTKKVLLLFALMAPLVTMAQRIEVPINDNWNFRFSHQPVAKNEHRVDLPHTWNAKDAISGKLDYKRGIGNYRKEIFIKQKWHNKRLFIRFEGANSVTNLLINGKHIGEHRGGYSAFIFEITDHVNFGESNEFLVRVNNGEQFDVMPLVGDFNMYGGIYRGVELLVTDQSCISPLDYSSPGVYITQEEVSEKSAKISTKVMISSTRESDNLELQLRLLDGDKAIFTTKERCDAALDSHTIDFEIDKPHLWNGRKDPFLYHVELSLLKDGVAIDQVVQPLGVRYFSVDPDKGFFLNGEHLALHGVCRHQDRANLGNALRDEHHAEDVALITEMGANAVRLAHYHQSKCTYDLMDENGVIVWAEIPFVGPGGYADTGFIDLPAFKENGRTQLRELIRQNYNHPSICVWGLFNELKESGDNPVEYIKELNEIAHSEDKTRPTVAASNQDSGEINLITDLIGWNRYFGWYGGDPQELATFLDATHESHPHLNICISEYGAGASIYHQQEMLKKCNPSGLWHPENWQTHYHIENWKIIAEREYIWGSFIWCMFDFGAAHRTEGDQIGVNDKGLVSFDRKDRKDSFYFYKANWNKEQPTLHIAEKRIKERKNTTQSFTVFTTSKKVELIVNGKSCGVATTDQYAIASWSDIEMQYGANTIQAISRDKDGQSDQTVITILE